MSRLCARHDFADVDPLSRHVRHGIDPAWEASAFADASASNTTIDTPPVFGQRLGEQVGQLSYDELRTVNDRLGSCSGDRPASRPQCDRDAVLAD